MSRVIDLKPEHYNIVAGILREYVPEHEVIVFGSRATGMAREKSDLDLCIMGPSPLSLSEQGKLADAFDESPLPFKVDVIEWASLEKWFQDIVRKDGIKFNGPDRS